MEKKRVLITYATYGSGHKTVAGYIYDYLVKHSDYEVKMIDLMDYENIIGFISKKAFETNFKAQGGQYVFTFFYELFDFKSTTLPYKYIAQAIFKKKKLKDDIMSFNPDLLISSHFFGNIMMGIFNKQGLTNTKIISIITDYKSHEFWLKDEESIDALVVGNDIVKNEVIQKGINEKKVYSFGIPILENFSIINDKKVKEKYHVNNEKLTFLFFAGGSIGSNFTYKFLRKLLEERYDINIIFVCGKNEKLKKKVELLVSEEKYENVTILGFSNEVNKLLYISDVVITKPGGLSVTECLEMKKPMLLVPGNGGQELYNAKFICKHGYGISCQSSSKLVSVVGRILKRPGLLNNMNKNLKGYANNKSVEKIYNLTTKILKDKK